MKSQINALKAVLICVEFHDLLLSRFNIYSPSENEMSNQEIFELHGCFHISMFCDCFMV